MLPRADILLNRIRQESDMVDANSLSNLVLLQYMNDAQRTIQNVVFQSDQLNNVFTNYVRITAIPGQNEYDLPSNTYAENSLISVWTLNSDNTPGQRYAKSAFGERAQAFAYSVRNRKIRLNHDPSQDILVYYNYRLPTIQERGSKVGSISGQVITLDGATFDDETLSSANFEWVTIVDKYGTQIVTDLYIDSLIGLSLTVEGDLTAVTSNHYVIPGRNSSSNSSLPEECETYLKIFTGRKALAHINSKKLYNSTIFTKEERTDIADLFADKHSDIEYPVTVDYDYLDY